MSKRQVLLLIGSPRGTASTSQSLGSYIVDGLEEKGFKEQRLFISQILDSEGGRDRLLSAVEESYLLILSYPLYVDTLPAPVIRSLELIREQQTQASRDKDQRLIAVVNCGFPEASQTANSLASCRRFALETGMDWKGGLALGMGGFVDGRQLEELGRLGDRIREALDLTIEAISRDEELPQTAIDRMADRLMPSWLYTFLGSMNWRIQAWKNGCYFKLYDKPFK